ncbi:MAG: threonylcarbamoyl-AMP synthase [Bacteroidales bacterium]|jgi:L-threonylcarbamoyladenylate synthase|nr:threonylcarbamoyl-AMP synthase [Bacteroidales bacterium]
MKELEILANGGVILYPTDTIWGIGCDATNEEAILKVQKIKGRVADKSLIVLMSDVKMLSDYVDASIYERLEKEGMLSQPTTIIYPAAKKLPVNVLSNNKSLAVRIPQHNYCYKLIHSFGKPIVSTSANISGYPSPLCFDDISYEIKQQVDYICEFEHQRRSIYSASSILMIDNLEVKRLR